MEYGLQYKSRCIEPQRGHSSSARFFVATASLVEENQIHVLEVSEEEEDVACCNVYPHAAEVVALSGSPTDANLLFTSSNDVSRANSEVFAVRNRVTLWRLNSDDVNASLERVAELPVHTGDDSRVVTALLWEEALADTLFTVEQGRLLSWTLSTPDKPSQTIALADQLVFVGGASLNPHFSTVVAVCVGDAVLAFDTRDTSSGPVWKLKGDSGFVRDCDFNPNKPYFLCSGGDAGVIRFWDYRKPATFVNQKFAAQQSFLHSHWVTSVEYNPHHDSLVLSSGTDGTVNLYSAKSVSSAPVASNGAAAASAGGQTTDYVISSYDRFRQSVYRACWSSADAWTYASVSYDGKVCFLTVNDKEKMSILTE